jgi:hypothetical protein
MHSTNELNDGYIGSGKILWYSIKKYGKENFNFEILEFLPNRKKLKIKEKEIVNEGLLKDSLCMNLKQGGDGGFSNEEHRIKFLQASKTNGAIEKGREKIKELRKDKNWVKWHSERVKEGKLKKTGFKGTFNGKKHTKESKDKIRKAKIGKTPINLGKKMTENQKNKISDSLKNWFKNNPKTKRVWITDGINSKLSLIDTPPPEGWRKGRN